MTVAVVDAHDRFLRAVRGAIVADIAFALYPEREPGWQDVREAWMRPQRNFEPTPWSGLTGRPNSRTGKGGDLAQRDARSGLSDARSQGLRKDGRTKVFLDEDHYYYALEPGVLTAAREVDGPFTWRYAGQLIFSRNVRQIKNSWRPEGPLKTGVSPDEDLDTYFGVGKAVRWDKFGRLWVLDGIDRDKLRTRLEAYDAGVRAMAGRPEITETEPPARKFVAAEREHESIGFGGPLYWTWTSCSGMDNPRNIETSGYPLAESGTPMVETARKAVLINRASGSLMCTGTLVDDRHILTAAHCMVDSDLDADDMVVCTYGNRSASVPSGETGGCYTVGWSHPRSSYDPDAWFDPDDAAIITLDDHLTGSQMPGWMPLSERSSSSGYGSFTDKTRGFPGRLDDCSSNTISSSSRVTTASVGGASQNGAVQFYAKGAYLSSTAYRLTMEVSVGHGMSGGPHYYCPSGDCDDGHWHTGVCSFFEPGMQVWGGDFVIGAYSGAVRSSRIRSWVAGYSYEF